MIWWGELLVLHQGTQALITVSGASFVFLIFLPRHWSHLAVQLYKLQNKNKPKKHKIGHCMIITKGNLKEFGSINVHSNIEFRSWDLHLCRVLQYGRGWHRTDSHCSNVLAATEDAAQRGISFPVHKTPVNSSFPAWSCSPSLKTVRWPEVGGEFQCCWNF